MDRRTSALKETIPGDFTAFDFQSERLCKSSQTESGKVLELGKAFVKTVRHFWPDFSSWLENLPDSRFEPYVVYDKKFLVWWAMSMFAFKLGSRRQLDFELRDEHTCVLSNLNKIAKTNQETLPVHDTLDHFLGHVGSEPLADLRTQMIRRLIRMKALDAFRLNGFFIVAIDGTGYLSFSKRHCPHCIVQKHSSGTYYLHPVEEAKIVGNCGLALSIGTEFVENPPKLPASNEMNYENQKQDCELKAFSRLAFNLKKDFPQTPLCISSDCLYACGSTIQICKDNGWSYIFTIKENKPKTVWQDFQGLLLICPENTLSLRLPDGTLQLYRWVNDISYEDEENNTHTFDVIQCYETAPNGKTTTFAWITSFHVTANNVVSISIKGGRLRWNIENQGFNTQKNSGLNLEHAYSFHQENLKSFYYLLQIAHIILQMLEKGSLLKNLSKQFGKIPLKLFGSLKNIARRLLECFRYMHIPDSACEAATRFQIRLDSS